VTNMTEEESTLLLRLESKLHERPGATGGGGESVPARWLAHGVMMWQQGK